MNSTETNQNAGRPIHDAAEELQLLANDARAMLAQLRKGWLWQILTINPKKPS